MKIWVYTIAYNEEAAVKNFLRSYSAAEKIIVYDNMSTDNTVKLFKEDKRVEIRPYISEGMFKEEEHIEIKNNCWKESRGKADWAILADMDEIFSRQINGRFDLDLKEPYLKEIPIIKATGYCIFSLNMPFGTDFNPLDLPLMGMPDEYSDKPCCLQPSLVKELELNPGSHTANPIDMQGKLVSQWKSPEYILLHLKYCNFRLFFKNLAKYQPRLFKDEIEKGYGVHHTWSIEKFEEIYMKGLSESKLLFKK